MVYFAYLICFFWDVKRFQSNTVTCSIQYAFFTSSVVQINQSGVPILEIGKLRTYQKKKKRKKKGMVKLWNKNFSSHLIWVA